MLHPRLASSSVSVEVDSARRDWAAGHSRFVEASRDVPTADRLHRQVEVLFAELRRRVGGTFTTAELAREYGRADAWARDAVELRAPSPGWSRTLSLSLDEAFHLYARGAQDYRP
jgi:hypothetical protein